VRNGTNLELRTLAGAVLVARPYVGVASVQITGAGGANDSLRVDYSGGDPLPAGGVSFDGGAGGTDRLAVRGTGGQVVVYTPNSTTNGSGTITVAGAAITFGNLEPVDFDNVGTFTLSLPNGADVVTVSADFNTVT